jgi:hypothetical protein
LCNIFRRISGIRPSGIRGKAAFVLAHSLLRNIRPSGIRGKAAFVLAHSLLRNIRCLATFRSFMTD